MDIVIASGNQGKVREIKRIVEPFGLNAYSMTELGLFVDPDETGTTFYQNAMIKAKALSELTELPVLSDDSGLIVPALNNEPGVLSARYAGAGHDDRANNVKLLKNMENISERTAYFMSVVVLYFSDGTSVYGEGTVMGRILRGLRGTNGFGYDPLFYSDELKKSFGEATDVEKDTVSHRQRALLNLVSKLKSRID